MTPWKVATDFDENYYEKLKIWISNHKSEHRLSKEGSINRQNNLLFSDYDLYLEQKNDNGSWSTVKNVNVVGSNVELIRYVSNIDAEYRIRVYKKSNSSSWNSIPDKLAVTYTKV